MLPILLLLIAIASGTLLTYVYCSRMHFAARLCTGTCTGFALIATVGFIAASFLGLNHGSIGIAAGLVSLPWLLLLRAGYRSQVASDLAEAWQGTKQAVLHPGGAASGYAIFYISVAVLLGVIFGHVMFQRPDGIYTGLTNNLGDLPFHLQIISSFAHGQNFPPEDPAFSGVRFAYPFLADFLTAMLVRSGASLIFAMWIQNFALGLVLVGMMHYWTLQLTHDRLAGVIAPLLILLSGGLGWWLLFGDAQAGDSGLIGVLQHLPRDYTIAGDTIWRWGNSLTTLFIPQRSILFGVPLAVFIFSQWWLALNDGEQNQTAWQTPASTSTGTRKNPAPKNWEAVSVSVPTSAPTPKRVSSKATKAQSSGEATAVAIQPGVEAENAVVSKEDIASPASAVRRRMIAAGVFAGMLPLVHAHSFIVVMGMAGCLALLFPQWRAWIAFFVPALVIALPEILWSTHRSGINAQTFWGWAVGWDRGNNNAIWFWLANTGAFIPLLIAAIFLRKHGRDLVSSKLLRFYLPFLLCFLVPNLMKLAPWAWDNIKVLFYWYVASAPLVALMLASWFREAKWRWAAATLLAVLTLAGTLDIVRVLTGTTEYREFDSDGAAIAEQILQRTEPRALVLHAPIYNPPVFLTGRRSLLGYPGSIWSRGLDYGLRESDIRQIYSGSPEALSLLRRYKVNYVLLSPLERDYLNGNNLSVNENFWSQFPVIAQSGEYRLYKIESGR